MSGTRVRLRFAELWLPKFAPPLRVWSIVGAAYYVLFFFLLKSLLGRPATPPWTAAALVLTTALLIANAVWNWVFFRKRDIWWSFVFLVPYLFIALTLAIVLFRVRSPLLGWYILYPIYLIYAGWWVRCLWRLNNDPSEVERHVGDQ
jgi:tryptophan-rich sensory protein